MPETRAARGEAPGRIGLSSAEAGRRLARDGPNVLPRSEQRHWPRVLLGTLREPMLLLLLAATAVYLLLGSARDAVVLGVSVLVVVALALYQELRSERALQALRELGSPHAQVWRDGQLQRLPAAEVVVGDLIRIAEGDRVPADARVQTVDDLLVDESLLTGESVPVAKSIADPHAQVRAGTLAVRGQATAEVEATGAGTELGRIGASLGQVPREPTPLQREMRRVVALFAVLALLACAAVVFLHVARNGDWLQALLAGITLAMANIPEEFPVVLSVFLALGGWRMARRRVLVRRPPAIEALGAITVLCTDKTGTLTENRMTLAQLRVDGQPPVAPSAAHAPAFADLLRTADLASDASGHDPMDHAIHVAAQRLQQDAALPCLRRYPVSPELPVYASAWREPGGDLLIACKGAPETVVALCGLAPADQSRLLADAADMAKAGLRVIATARARLQATAGPEPAAAPATPRGQPFQWLGLLGLRDPLRHAVPAAVAEAQAAGVRVLMLTGDHVETARAIAREAGIGRRSDVALGPALDGLDAAGLRAVLARTDVFARVRPADKLRLVQALREAGDVVAMTGDGVNDAPALAAAHVGVAMGRRGTDVAREAAAIVLMDDDFVSVVRAIRMGRTIHDNIRRAACYIIAVHLPITGLALLPLLIGAPLVLLPLHVVVMEMIIDPASCIVLEREPPAADVMRRPPRSPRQRLIDADALVLSAWRGLLVLAAVCGVYFAASAAGLASPQRSALAFATLVMGNVGLIVLHRSAATPWQALRQRNRPFWILVAITLAGLLLLSRWPTAARWFDFTPPPLDALALAALLAFALPWAGDRMGRLVRHVALRTTAASGHEPTDGASTP